MRIVKISKQEAINPRHVIAVILDKKNLRTIVVMIGGVSVPSEHDFDKTVELLNG